MLTFALRCFTSMMMFPGMMYIANAAGMIEFPAEMRMPEKMDFIGAPLTSEMGKALCIAIGAGKVTVALNNFLIKSPALDAMFALTSIPGFGLVLYVHRQLPNPDGWSAEVPVILMPIMLCMIWMLGSSKDSGKKKA